jgi:multiple sugar transport system permease protein
VRNVARHAALAVAALAVLLPVVWIGAAGFKTQIVLLTGDISFTPTLANFASVLNPGNSDYRANFANSLAIALGSTALVLIAATLATHALRHMRWPRFVSPVLLGWSVLFHMVPPITLAGAWYVMFRMIGLDNSIAGLILAHATLNLPMALWMLLIFMQDLPVEILEAARIDGASGPQLLGRIIVPLIRLGIAAAGVLAFVFSWNEFTVTLTLSQRQTATVPIAIGKYAQENTINYTEMAAAAVLATIPAIILVLLAQRFIVRGLTAGATK